MNFLHRQISFHAVCAPAACGAEACEAKAYEFIKQYNELPRKCKGFSTLSGIFVFSV